MTRITRCLVFAIFLISGCQSLPSAAANIELPPPPETEQATRSSMRRRVTRLAKAVVGAVILAGVVVVAYQYEEDLRDARKSPRPVPAVKKPAVAADVGEQKVGQFPAAVPECRDGARNCSRSCSALPRA